MAFQSAFSNILVKGKITTSDVVDLTGRSKVTAIKLLKKLVDKDILKWHGNSRYDPKQFYSLD
jgi:ATP-dependent DNA helicase RecG